MGSYDATPLLLKHPANGVARWDPVLPSLLPAGGLNFIEADVFEVIRCDSTIPPHLMLINADIFEGIYRGPIAGPRGAASISPCSSPSQPTTHRLYARL